MRYIKLLLLTAAALTSVSSNKTTLGQCSHVMKGRKHSSCTLFPLSIVGPFFRPNEPVRSDIRDGKPGIQLDLILKIVDVSTCKPVVDVAVDIWQADAYGKYSTFEDSDLAGTVLQPKDTKPKTALRGTQYTSKKGTVKFITIYPGWYNKRTAHIHLEIQIEGKKHVIQLYFPDTLTDRIAERKPYTGNQWDRTRNSQDCIFLCYNGVDAIINLDRTEWGYESYVLIGMQLEGFSLKQDPAPQTGYKCYFGKDDPDIIQCKRLKGRKAEL